MGLSEKGAFYCLNYTSVSQTFKNVIINQCSWSFWKKTVCQKLVCTPRAVYYGLTPNSASSITGVHGPPEPREVKKNPLGLQTYICSLWLFGGFPCYLKTLRKFTGSCPSSALIAYKVTNIQ